MVLLVVGVVLVVTVCATSSPVVVRAADTVVTVVAVVETVRVRGPVRVAANGGTRGGSAPPASTVGV